MINTSAPGFITSSTFVGRHFSRRPRLTKCNCTRHFVTTPIRRTTILSINQDEPETTLDRPPPFDIPDDITSSKGFALREAAVYPYEILDYAGDKFVSAGAYAIRDASGQIAYMGYSKNIAKKLNFHASLLPDQCISFQVYVPPGNDEFVSPEMLENVLEFWLRENGTIPRGNTVDSALWEQENPTDRKTTNSTVSVQPASDIPIRERTTPERIPTRRPRDPNTSRQTTGNSQYNAWNSWDPSDEDFVEVDVDPLDPFSASRKRRTTRSPWDSSEFDDDEVEEDWIPLLALAGCAGLIWLFGVLSNALPAATPSLGM